MQLITDITVNKRTRRQFNEIRLAWREFKDDLRRDPWMITLGLLAAMVTAVLMMLPWLTFEN